MVNPKFGDIYLTKFHPSSKSELRKFRPAVIASTTTNKIDSRHTLICAITTQITKRNQSEILITDNPAIKRKSLILAWYLWTIDVKRLRKKLGTLTPDQKSQLKKTLKSLFS